MSVRTNLMTEPSSETGSSNWITTNSTNAFSTAFAHSGTHSLLITKNGSAGFVQCGYGSDPNTGVPNSQAFAVTAGHTYTFSYWVRTGSSGASARADIFWETSSAFISTASGSSPTLTVGAWTRISVTSTAPGSATKCAIALYVGSLTASSADTYADDFLFEESATLGTYFSGDTSAAGYTYNWTGTANNSTSTETTGRTNLVKNPSFETNSTGWVGESGVTLTRDSTTSWDRGTSLKCVYGTSPTLIAVYGMTTGTVANSDAIPVTAGQQVTISVYEKSASGTGSGVGPTIYWFNSSGAQISHGSNTTFTTTTSWARYSYTATAPAGATQFGFGWTQPGTTGVTVWLDAWLVEISSALGSYFDGSTVTTGLTRAWTGTTDASTSTETIASAGNTMASALSGSGTLTAHLGRTLVTTLSGSGTLTSSLTNYRRIASPLSGSGTLNSALGRLIASPLSGSGTLTSHLALHIAAGLSGSGTLSSILGRTINTTLSGSGTLVSHLTNYRKISSALSSTGTLASVLSNYLDIDSPLSGSGTLTSALTNYRKIASSFSSTGTLSILVGRFIHVPFSGSGALTSHLTHYLKVGSAFRSEGILYSEMGYVLTPTPLSQTSLGKLSDFNVATSGVPVNPAKGAGSVPAITATYVEGTNPEYSLGEDNSLSNGAIGTYEGEIVRLTLPTNSARATVSMYTPLTKMNIDAHLFPFIDGVPGMWTAARAIDYWTQHCGLFYDDVPGKCVAYASGFGHTMGYASGQSARFYEILTGGATDTVLIGARSVKTFGAEVSGATGFHETPLTPTTPALSVPLAMPKNHKGLFSIGMGLRGSGRTATVTWSFLDKNKAVHTVSISGTSAGVITATVDGLTVDTASVTAGANYRITLSLEILSTTAIVGKLTVHTDDLAGNGTAVYTGHAITVSHALPGVLNLISITHASTGGSGDQMLRWGTYLSADTTHPMQVPAIQKVLSQTVKTFGFVSGFSGNVWTLMNEFCFFARLDVRWIGSMLHVDQRDTALTAPGGSWTVFSPVWERRDKFKQVAVTNRQSKAVTTGDGVLWKADSVFQLNTREVFETTVQTNHSILSVVNPVPVPGILPFPYKQGTGQYVVTGADGYIIAPAWWLDHGGKIECSLTAKEGEIAIKITAPRTDSVRAPYRISEGAADRPALYISGSGIVNDPKDVVVGTGASNAKEGHDTVYASPFISGLMETYDAAMAMAAEYSAASAVVSFELPNDFDTPTGLGQSPVGRIVTDNSRNYRITDTTQSKSKVTGNAVAHTTIGQYVASYPAGATVADEVARHSGKTIRQFNIKPLRSSSDNA